jgi:hypothetical protein
VLVLALLACAPETADIKVDASPTCGEGFALGDDGRCYELDGGDADTDADTDSDTDSDTDTDTDTGTDTGPVDADEDGSPAEMDCDDADASRFPGAQEVCDGIDQDCDAEVDEGVTATVWTDGDGDVTGYADRTGDCDDGDAAVSPDAADDTHDGVDNDCDGAIDEDWDACAVPFGALDEILASYGTSSAGGVLIDLSGYAWVCEVSCPDWWLTADGLTIDNGATFEALPYLVDPSAQLQFSIRDPGARGESSCTIRTSTGTLTFTARWTG